MIVGAGPCGLACARELDRLRHQNWILLERAHAPGGLARSVLDPAGFTWDLGGHVVFSVFGEFDNILHDVIGDDLLYHDRSSYIRFSDRWVPYPFQNNLRYLPDAVTAECLAGLAAVPGGTPDMDFETWILATFGAGIARYFMTPYNRKVWATPLTAMSARWIAERVSVVDYAHALANVRDGRDDVAWGPNNTFAFPRAGGTGEIYRRLALRLADRLRYRTAVVEIDADGRLLRTADGTQWGYDALVSTMPLDRLVSSLRSAPDAVRSAASDLVHNGVLMVGVGYEAPLTDTKSWTYFPSPHVPFYRVTNFAKYSAANVPGGKTDRLSSYMTETAYSRHLPGSRSDIETRVECGLREAGVVKGRPEVASVHVEDIKYAYPVPTLNRDRALAVIQPWLMKRAIYSRGRFGAWRYETGNMDHAVKMGIDVARSLVTGAPEEVWTL